MKYTVVLFFALVASLGALPHNEIEIVDNTLMEDEQRNNGPIGDLLASALEQISRDIVAAGLDPWESDGFDSRIALPVPTLFSAHAFAGDLHFSGLSNIVINQIRFGILNSRLTFDISLPAIKASVRDASLASTIFSQLLEFRGNGKIEINELRVKGEARVSIGIFTGISVRDLVINFSLGGVQSDIYANILGVNYSDKINKLAGETIPSLINSHEHEINELIMHYAEQIIEGLLN